MDEGHELTEKELQKLEKRITAEYRQAAREVAAKYEAWNAKFAAADAKQQAKLAAGEISKADYQQWVLRQRMIGSDWKTMSDILAKDLVNADNIARKMIGEEMPNVYALNANYGTYQIEHTGIDTGFTLYNHDTAEVLLKQENIALMPGPTGSKAEMLREAADLKWNRQKINSAVLQGVLQGEGAKKVAQRLMGVAQMDANAAIRYARTMTTSAQNAGRYQSYRRAKALGIDLTIEWQATLDNRTRHEHRMMHGQRREVDEPFEVSGFKILYPAEAKGKSSDIPQSMIWNCRCTLLAWVKGFEPDTVKSSPKMRGMTFEEWQTAKAPKGISDKLRATKTPVYGTAKTVQEAQEQARALGVKYVGMDGWTIERANNAVQAVSALPSDCRPVAVLNGKGVEVITERKMGRNSSQWYGVTYDYRAFDLNTAPLGYGSRDFDGGIVVGLNTDKFKTLDALTKEKERQQKLYMDKTGRKWFFNTKGEAVAFHEMGHAYADVRGLPSGFEFAAERWAKESGCDMLKSPSEAFAEAFAAYHVNDDRLPDYILQYMKDLD